MERYDPRAIEARWQRVWEDEHTWEVSNEPDEHPRESTEASFAQFRTDFRSWGISIDWDREFGTHEPRYYRWTQWIFLRLFEKGLAYRKEAAVNWCPQDATVLANEQVIDGRCERCGSRVEVRQLEQWFFRITAYADRLLDDLKVNDSQEVREYIARAASESAEERGAEDKEKTGVPLGRTVTNPVNGEEIPMFVADYVLMEYGTGAIMAVPAHDERDYAFAEAFGLEIRRVVEPAGGEAPEGEAYVGHSENERLINSCPFTGPAAPEAIERITAWLAHQ